MARNTLQKIKVLFLVFVVLYLVVRWVVVEPFIIPSTSMVPTLLVNDHILVNKFIYGIRLPFTKIKIIPTSDPQKGDVAVFHSVANPGIYMVKRVLGLPGEKISYLKEGQSYEEVVPENSYFMMGDNRDHSQDSRYWGAVPRNHFVGKAVLVWLSCTDTLKNMDFICDSKKIRWDRLLHRIE